MHRFNRSDGGLKLTKRYASGDWVRTVHFLTTTGRQLSAFFACCALVSIAHADLVVPAGGNLSLNGGTSNLSCTDVVVAGTLNIDSGSLTGVRNVSIQAGGSITVTSGTLSLSGDWSNAGSFTGGTGLVSFVDLAGCATGGGTIGGNTTFSNLSFVSGLGKTYQIASGSTQTVAQFLTVQGSSGLPLVLRGATPGSPAFIALLGDQSINYFGAADLTSTGKWLAPNQTNAINGAGVTRVFGDPNPPIPTLHPLVVLLLGALLAGLVSVTMRKRPVETRTP